MGSAVTQWNMAHKKTAIGKIKTSFLIKSINWDFIAIIIVIIILLFTEL
jgi:hypothetical protein